MKTLIRCFNRQAKLFLQVRLNGLENDLGAQVKVLNSFKLSPLILRLFRLYCTAIYRVINVGKAEDLLSLFQMNNNNVYSMRRRYILPKIRFSRWQASFRIISTKILNSFLLPKLSLPYNEFVNDVNKNLLNYYNKAISDFT
jgi:hypothetical protein